jgi:iron complex transport system substrate-binding protein
VAARENRRSPAALIAALISVLLVAGGWWPVAGSAAFPIAIRDATGHDVLIPAQPRRIVSLTPSVTEILFALDLDREVVGVSDADDYPPDRVTRKARVGGVVISIERVVALRPDLVIGIPSLQRDQLARLVAAGLRVLAVDAASADDTVAQIRVLGRATGRMRQAEAVAGRLADDLAAAHPTVRRSVYIEVWNEPIIAAARGTLVDDLVGRAGGVNIFSDLRGYPQVSAEAVIVRNPQIIFVLYAQSGGLVRRSAWHTIEAVRTHRVQGLPASLVSRPGPRIGQGLALITRGLQGPR